MKKVILSGTKTLTEVKNDFSLNFCPVCVNGTSRLAQMIKFFEDSEETKDIAIELNGRILPDMLASDYNHLGVLMHAMYRMSVKMGWFNITANVKVNDIPYMNTMIYEETQYPGCATKAANLLTQIEDYEAGLTLKRDKSLILCVPKFKKDDAWINDFIRKRTGNIKYAYGNLAAFIASFKLSMWIGSTDPKRGTCSEEGAESCKIIAKHLIENITPEDPLWYDFYSAFENSYEIAPVHFLLHPDLFEYYLIIEEE